MMDFDEVKSKTLLFFYEYILLKGEPQSIQSLACQFGNKAFTKDMQIFVSSKAG